MFSQITLLVSVNRAFQRLSNYSQNHFGLLGRLDLLFRELIWHHQSSKYELFWKESLSLNP